MRHAAPRTLDIERTLNRTVMFMAWAFVKLICLHLFVFGPGEYSDTVYYFEQAKNTGGDLSRAMVEYPTPAAALLLLPYWLGAHSYDSYRLGFLALIIALEALFVLLLIRHDRWLPLLVWIVLETAGGRLTLLRFDVIPAVTTATVVLAMLGERNRFAGSMAAIGTAIKLWPVVVAPTLWLDKTQRRRSLTGFATSAAVLVLGCIAAAGVQRLVSPLGFQNKRGLQVESVWASVPMMLRLRDPNYKVFYAASNSFEITGPSVDAWLVLSNAATVVGVGLCIWLWWRWQKIGAPAPTTAPLSMLIVLVVVVSSKVLSPQYLLWCAPLVAVWAVSQTDWRTATSWLWLTGLLLLTFYVYPVHYDDMVLRNNADTVTVTNVLVARNVGLLAYTGWLAWQTFRDTRERPARRVRTVAAEPYRPKRGKVESV